ncbi:radical SAM protein, partial [Candidatus Pacearchaeota archaeon]|nr:radical SAM protein [Candidatus Pacearchaeota archaeon]
MKVVLVAFYDVHSIGIRTLQPILESAGHDVVSVFFKNHYVEDRATDKELQGLAGVIDRQNCEALGLGVRSVVFPTIKRMLPMLKSRPFIIIGGHHASVCPEECIEYADAVCVGEGEVSLPKNLLRPGIWELEPLVQDLDTLPNPVYDDNQLYVYAGPGYKTEVRLSVIATRGCFFDCSYCYNHVYKGICDGLGKYIRRRSVDSVVNQVHELKSRFSNLCSITISDSVFTYGKKWLNEFCNKWPSTGLSFRCYGHFTMLSEKILHRLKNAGCEMISIGYQHGSERMRNKVFKRPETNKQIIDGTEMIARVGIPARYDKIVNCQYETDNDMKEYRELF